MEVAILPETTEDYKDIHAVNAAAFGPAEGAGKAVFVDTLRRTERFIPGLSLVARHNGKIVGHILLYPIDILQGNRKVETLSLALLSVLPEFQNNGIGSGLVNAGISNARRLGFRSVIVLGHESYYPRFGFSPAGAYGITAAFADPDFAFMALELQPEALKTAHGILKYPKEFDGI